MAAGDAPRRSKRLQGIVPGTPAPGKTTKVVKGTKSESTQDPVQSPKKQKSKRKPDTDIDGQSEPPKKKTKKTAGVTDKTVPPKPVQTSNSGTKQATTLPESTTQVRPDVSAVLPKGTKTKVKGGGFASGKPSSGKPKAAEGMKICIILEMFRC